MGLLLLLVGHRLKQQEPRYPLLQQQTAAATFLILVAVVLVVLIGDGLLLLVVLDVVVVLLLVDLGGDDLDRGRLWREIVLCDKELSDEVSLASFLFTFLNKMLKVIICHGHFFCWIYAYLNPAEERN